jgi:hypothetical protein
MCSKYKHVFNSIKNQDTHKKKKLCLPPYILQQYTLFTNNTLPSSP